MPVGLLIPLLLLAIPILEIAVFIFVGGEIGIFPTLAMIFVTAVIGTILLRLQGFALIARIRGEMQANRIPGRDLAHGAMLLAAGILLLTPGFVTDSIGFLLFVPPIRDAISAFVASRMKEAVIVQATGRRPGPDFGSAGHPMSGDPSSHPSHSGPNGPDIVELDPDDFERKPDPTSPWNAENGDDDAQNGSGSNSDNSPSKRS